MDKYFFFFHTKSKYNLGIGNIILELPFSIEDAETLRSVESMILEMINNENDKYIHTVTISSWQKL